MHDEFDDRTDDDMPPAAILENVFQVTVGEGWKAEATADGTLMLIERKSRRGIEIGFSDFETITEFLAEAAQAGGAWASLERYARGEHRQPVEATPLDVFSVFAGAMRDAEAVR